MLEFLSSGGQSTAALEYFIVVVVMEARKPLSVIEASQLLEYVIYVSCWADINESDLVLVSFGGQKTTISRVN